MTLLKRKYDLKSFNFLRILVMFLIAFIVNQLCAQNIPSKPQAPLFDNLGNFHFPITTKNPLAQHFFDQGFILFYAFEWGESIRSFKEAARLDPTCAMCYWGVAIALGNKVNAPMNGHEYADGKVAIQKARDLAPQVTPKEQDYIKALSMRYQHQPKTVDKEIPFHCHGHSFGLDASTRQELLEYANALKQVMDKYPEDMEAKTLYAGALFWNLAGTKPAFNNPHVQSAINILKTAIVKVPKHLGANHYYIHMIEPYTPKDALKSAELFKTLVPGSEHLVHMPAHIYFLIGRYRDATEANLKAIKVFHQYNQITKKQGFEPEINYLYFHNYDFLRSSATIEGRKQLALTTVKQMVAEPFPTWLKNEAPLQWFIPIPGYVKLRFGMWDDVLKEPMPQSQYQYATGMWHYTQGMALLQKDKINEAEEHKQKLGQIIQKGSVDVNLGDQGLDLLNIAYEVLAAKLADQQGDEKAVINHLKKAMQVQDNMGYHEPPDWYFPIKEALADAYLKWNHPKEAIEMYQQALIQYPKDGWILYGLAKSLQKLGRPHEAEAMENEFKKAWQHADIPTPIALF